MKNLWRRIPEPWAVIALLISIFAGKLQFPVRRLGWESSPWFELRLWALLAALVLLVPHLRRLRLKGFGRSMLITLAGLLLYLFVRSFFDVFPDTPAKRLDLFYLGVQTLLVAVVVSRTNLVEILGYNVLALATIYLTIAIGGQLFECLGSKENFGLGWGPIGGPITFNRIQFLAACVSLCFAAASDSRRKLMFDLLATIFLFATFASIQKAAILSAFLSLGTVTIFFVTTGEMRRMVSLLIIVTVATTAFYYMNASRLSARLAGLTQDNLKIPPQSAEGGDGPAKHFLITEFGIIMQYCSSPSPRIPDITRIPCQTVEFKDRTSRLVFASEAIRGFLQKPIFGNGIASFSVTVPDPYTLRPDTYRYPHNMILEIASEGGLVALASMAVAITAAFCGLCRSQATIPTRTYIGMFMMFLFLSTMFSGDFYDSRLFWVCAAALAFWKEHDSLHPPAPV